MDIKIIALTIRQIAEDNGIPKEKVTQALEQALAAAYKKEYGAKGQKIEAEIDSSAGETNFWQIKEVVTPKMIYSEEELENIKAKGEETENAKEEEKEDDKEKTKIRFSPEKHIMLAEAKKIDPNAKASDNIRIPVETVSDFGRIASQTAKQVILQKLKEAEKEIVLSEFKEKEGKLISGIVQQVNKEGVYFDIGKATGYLPEMEQPRGEFYRPGQRMKLYVLKVEERTRGTVVLLSRAYPKIVSKLFELEVPEISSGQIEIKAIAREAGSRTKIAVISQKKELDPVGSLIGQRGSRVGAVIAELGGEKIDIVEYSDNPQEYIKNALAPAKIVKIKLLSKNTARALVGKDQFSLAIGREGQNVRLAAQLSGWKIDVEDIKEEETADGQKEEKENKEEKKEKKEKKGKKKNAKKIKNGDIN